MICSKHYNFMYVAVAKTATTLLEDILYKAITGENKVWDSQKKQHDPFYIQHVYWAAEKNKHVHKHSQWTVLDDNSYTWPGQYTFAFVRNPYDRLVSWYSYLTQKLTPAEIKAMEANSECGNFLTGENFTNFCIKAPFWIYKNQLEYIEDHSGNIVTDFIGRFENLQEDFDIVCDKIGIPQQQLPYKNKSNHKHYTEYYDDETRQIVAEKYAKDIELFGYKFGE